MNEVLQLIVLIGAALSAVIYIVSKFVRLFTTWFRFIQDWAGTEDKPGVMDRLDFIQSELLPNHGSSVKDQLNRLEQMIKDLPK